MDAEFLDSLRRCYYREKIKGYVKLENMSKLYSLLGKDEVAGSNPAISCPKPSEKAVFSCLFGFLADLLFCSSIISSIIASYRRLW